METIMVKYKLKPGSRERLQEWREYSERHRSAVLKTLEREGVVYEAAFLDVVGEDSYLLYLLRAHDVNKAVQIFMQSMDEVDQYQHAFLQDVVEARTSTELLVEFERS